MEADYLRAVSRAIPPERIERIAAAQAQRAEQGDAAALAWVTRWLLERAPTLSQAQAEALRLEATGIDAIAEEVARHLVPDDDGLETERMRQRSRAIAELARTLTEYLRGES